MGMKLTVVADIGDKDFSEGGAQFYNSVMPYRSNVWKCEKCMRNCETFVKDLEEYLCHKMMMVMMISKML